MKALSKAALAAVKLRYVIVLLVALGFARAGYHSSVDAANDWVIFEMGARLLVHWHGLSIYAGKPLELYANYPVIQIGPPALLPIVATQWLSPHTVNVLFVVAMAFVGVGALWFVEQTGRALTPLSDLQLRATVLIAGLPFMAALGYESGRFHHLDDAIALLCLAIAMWLCATKRSAWLVGIALGVSVATKPWAIVVLPLILGLPRAQRAKAVLAFFLTAVAFWGPFVVAAPRTIHSLGLMFVAPRQGSILWLLGVHSPVQHWLRPVQFAAGLAVGAYVAMRGRWTAAPLAGIAVRVALDPYAYGYYGLGPVLTALLWDLTRRPGEKRLPIWTAWTLFIEFGLHLFASPAICGVGRLVWVVSVFGVFLTARKRDVDSVAANEPELSGAELAMARS